MSFTSTSPDYVPHTLPGQPVALRQPARVAFAGGNVRQKRIPPCRISRRPFRIRALAADCGGVQPVRVRQGRRRRSWRIIRRHPAGLAGAGDCAGAAIPASLSAAPQIGKATLPQAGAGASSPARRQHYGLHHPLAYQRGIGRHNLNANRPPPRSTAARSVVPLPAIGSRTSPPGGQ